MLLTLDWGDESLMSASRSGLQRAFAGGERLRGDTVVLDVRTQGTLCRTADRKALGTRADKPDRPDTLLMLAGGQDARWKLAVKSRY
jgi:hypothetical protein